MDIDDLLCYLYVKSGSAETSGKTAIDFKSSEFHFQYVYLHYFFSYNVLYVGIEVRGKIMI